MENCDVCNAPMPGSLLVEHFRTEHPVEYKQRCVRPTEDTVEADRDKNDPASLCGCGEFHRRSERCGPW